MSITKFLFYILFIPFFWLPVVAQTTKTPNPAPRPQSQEDELTRHLSGAETYQLAGDLQNAAIENQAIIGIALNRMGNVALKEGQLSRAIKLLNDSIVFNDNSETRLNLAAAYLRSSETDKAITQAQAVLQIDADNFAAHYLLGHLFYTKGDYAAALPELEKTIATKPDFDSAYALGVTYLQLNQVERAKLLFEEMQTGLKSSAGFHILLAQAFEQAGFYPEAESELKKELAINPKTLRAHFYLGYLIYLYSDSARATEAGQEFEQELQLNPRDFYSNFFLGVVYNRESEYAKALPYFQKAIELNPDSGEAYLFLGQSQGELGEAALAEKNLRRSIELTTDASKNSFQIRRAHFLLGRVLLKSGRKAEAEKELVLARGLQEQFLGSARDEVSKILGQVVNSSNPVAGSEQSAAAAKIGSSTKSLNTENSPVTKQEAAEFLKIKIQLSQLLAQAFHNLGVIAAQQGSFDDALAKFAAAAEWQPAFPGLDRNWGITAFRATQFEKAIPPLARFVKAHPEDALTRRMLSVSYYLTKDYKQAVETLKPIETSLAGTDPELAYFYGISLVRLEKQPSAAIVFTRLSEQNPKSAQARFYAGQGFALVGDYERAVKEFRSVAALDAAFPQAHFNAGQALIRLNWLDEADKEFRQELQLNAVDEASKYYLAYTLLERKIQTDEALSLLRDAISLRYDYADARYQLGKALIEKGEIAEAIEQLETAARFDANKDYIHYQLSIAYRRAARPVDADRELKLYRDLKALNRSHETPGTMGAKENVP